MTKCHVLLLMIVGFFAVHSFPIGRTTEQPNIPPTTQLIDHLRKVKISGLRIDGPRDVVLGTTKRHATVIKPDSMAKVVMFGQQFQDIGAVTFTADGTCEDMDRFLEADFSSLTPTRLVVEMKFPKIVRRTVSQTDSQTEPIYKLCISEKFYNEPKFHILEDPFTTVTTEVPPLDTMFPLYISIPLLIVLLSMSGLFSGLNLGLMSLTVYELQLYVACGTENEKACATAVLPVRTKGNQLLTSLLLSNVVVNVAISLLLDKMLEEGVVVLLASSLAIVLFGEIIPQAICVKNGLLIGAITIPLTRILLFLTFVVSYPIGKILDIFLKEEITRSLERKKLMEMVKMSERNIVGETSDELKIVLGALELDDKTVADAMTKLEDIFMLPSDQQLDHKVLVGILKRGYTRIPIYEKGNPQNIVALLFVKDLALLDPQEGLNVMQVTEVYQHEVRKVLDDMPLRTMLEEFKRGEYHMALVERLVEHEDRDPYYELCGLITLEDIIEEIIQCEIIDETDAVCDNVNKKKRHRLRNNDMSHIVNAANTKCAISIQLLAVTIQVMSTTHPIFSSNFISPTILEKLIRTSCKKVETKQFSCIQEHGIVNKEPTKLYEKGSFSNKFIMILNGRVGVRIGREKMVYEGSSWHMFGTEVLDGVLAAIQKSQASTDRSVVSLNTELTNNIGFIPDFDAVINYECVFCEITTEDLFLAYTSSQIMTNNLSHTAVQRANSRTSLVEEIPRTASPIENGNGHLRTLSESETVQLLPYNRTVTFKVES